jgi:hypothetical protein
MQEIKQSTEVKVRVGPFVDKTDGFTPETGITLSGADEAELLKHNGAATVSISAATWAAVSSCDGWYDLTLTTSYTDTLGQLSVVVQDDSECLPVHCHFMVCTANYWDSKYSTDVRQVDVTQVGGDSQSATDLKDFADAGYDPGTNKVQGVVLTDTCTTLTGHTAQTGDNYARLGAPAGASVSADIAAVKSDTGNILDDTGTSGVIVATNNDKTGYSISGSKNTLDDLNDVSTADVNAQCDQALVDIDLDHLVQVTAGAEEPTDGSYIDQMMHKDGAQTFDPTTDSLEAIRDTAPLGTAMRGTDSAALASVCTEARLVELDAGNIPTDLTNIETDTQDLQTQVGTAGAGLTDLGGMSTTMKGQVNTEVQDVINTDTTTELGSAPAITAPLRDQIRWLFTLARNKRTTTATTETLRNDADSGDISTSTVSDNGTTFTRGEWS